MSHNKSYPSYKNSEVDWIDVVPMHWELRKVAWDMTMTIGWTPPTGDRRFYGGPHNWVSIADLSAGRITATKQTITDAAITEKKGSQAPAGSLLFSYKLSIGEVALLDSPAYTNEAIAAFHPCKRVSMSFWKYAAPVILPRYSRMNIYGSELLNQDLMSSARMYLPDVAEQEKIASHLDVETTRIDALIAKKTRFIELLKEKRQALITHAVTKGLDPDVKMKDSGVEWIGEVPTHWSIAPLKRDLHFLTSGSRGWAEHYSDNGSLFIRIGNLTRDSFDLDLSDIQRVKVPSGVEGERTKVQHGDILFSITAYLGSVALVPEALETAYVSQHVALARLKKVKMLPEWVAYIALSFIGKTYLETQGYGGTKIQLSLDDVANLIIIVPPIQEQSKIIIYLAAEISKINLLVNKTQRSIDLLKERRSALITAAVTGKIDLRESP